MIITLIIIAAIILSGYVFMQQKIFGKNPDTESLQTIKDSANYKDRAFQNLSHTVVTRKEASYLKMVMEFLNKPKDTTPTQIIPSIKTDLHNLNDDEPVIIWFGHSSYLIKHKGTTILVDPVFCGHASPFSFSVKAFP